MVSQFKDIKVLELASVLAGPSVGQFFAELGAEVIKVENLKTRGDVTRTWKVVNEKTDERSAYFCSVNWGKMSIAIDLTATEGQSIIHALASQSDIVIASFKPGDAEKLKVDYQTLSKQNPGLIYGQITGYGSDNPRVGYDAIIQAETGFMSMNGELGGASLKMPVALMDILAGHHLKEALLVAMIEKMKTGRGKLVEVSLIHAALASLANQATNWLVAGSLPQKQGSSHPNIAPYGDVFITKDGQELLLAVGSDRQFQDLCQILNLDLYQDGKYKTNKARVENRTALAHILENAISQLSTNQLMPEIHKAKIPSGLIQNIEQAFASPEAQSMLFNHLGLKGVKTFAERTYLENSSHFLPPPRFGEHTQIVLEKYLQFPISKVKALQENGIVK